MPICIVVCQALTKTHSKQKISIKHRRPSENDPFIGEVLIDPATYSASTEWELVSTEAKINEVKYTCCPEIYQDMTFNFVQRRFSYQPVLVLLVPCIITAMLILLTFFLPPDAGEKVGLSK